jgi:hypothetical protein
MLKGSRTLLQAAAVFLFCVLCVTKVRAEDWVFYARYGDSFFYDRETINNPYEDCKHVIGVWQKIVYDNESVDRITAHLGVKYADLAESISMIEMDCLNKNSQTKAITFYDKDGRILDAKNSTKADWREIPVKSPLRNLYSVLCPTQGQ